MVLKIKSFYPDIPQAQDSLRAELRTLKFTPPPHLRHDPMKLKAKENMLQDRINMLDKVIHQRLFNPRDKNIAASVINECRPAFLIQNGKFPDPVPIGGGDIKDWNKFLSPHRSDIEKSIESVGRIKYFRDGKEVGLATGFLVAEDIIMTCHHVVDYFCDYCDRTNKWTFNKYTKNHRIDYCEEKDSTKPLEFKIEEIVKAYDDPDLALVKVAKTTAVSWSNDLQEHPEPLVLADTMPNAADSKVYTIGYPDEDYGEPYYKEILGYNKDAYGVKRLSPGKILSSDYSNPQKIKHDCSLTYGSSGSCVFDIDSNKLIGLQSQGINTGHWNEAVALPNLDARIKNELKQQGIQFA
jgi:V8-like Glu-specific endopeptidase